MISLPTARQGGERRQLSGLPAVRVLVDHAWLRSGNDRLPLLPSALSSVWGQWLYSNSGWDHFSIHVADMTTMDRNRRGSFPGPWSLPEAVPGSTRVMSASRSGDGEPRPGSARRQRRRRPSPSRPRPFSAPAAPAIWTKPSLPVRHAGSQPCCGTCQRRRVMAAPACCGFRPAAKSATDATR